MGNHQNVVSCPARKTFLYFVATLSYGAKKVESEIVQSSLFDVGTDPRARPAPFHSDVAPPKVEQTPLFAKAKHACRVVAVCASACSCSSGALQQEIVEDAGI